VALFNQDFDEIFQWLSASLVPEAIAKKNELEARTTRFITHTTASLGF